MLKSKFAFQFTIFYLRNRSSSNSRSIAFDTKSKGKIQPKQSDFKHVDWRRRSNRSTIAENSCLNTNSSNTTVRRQSHNL